MEWLKLIHGTKPTGPAAFSTGDDVRVWYKILEQGKERLGQLEGIVIRVRGSGPSKTFTVRRLTHGVGVERVFPFDAPIIDRVELLSSGKAKRARLYRQLRTRFLEKGDANALAAARALVEEAQNLPMGDRERLFGYIEGGGKVLLSEPQALLTEASRMPGLDGQKMSKSYDNTISLREDAESVARKIRTMPTDPARVKRSDPGDPAKCPVWQFHLVYSDDKRREWVQQGCRSAGIGCLECKQPVIDAVLEEQKPMRERAERYLADPTLVRSIIADGCEKARKQAQETLREVKEVMGLNYT